MKITQIISNKTNQNEQHHTSHNTRTITYELTDPNSIQNAIKTIAQKTMNNIQNQMAHIIQIITQEILKQLKQNLQQAGLTYTETTDTITYTDQNQRSSQINRGLNSSLFIGHIQLQKWKNEPRASGWSTQADIIIDQQNIYIYSRIGPTNTYELTDPKAIQNAIQTITQKL